MARKRILLVDYEPKLLQRLESMLPADRYEVATAQDGFQALEEFDRFHPDLVFLRTMLPKKHGFQVCQEMVERAGSRYVPVVMHCSIYKSRKYRSDAMKIYGAAEYLEDPIEENTLKEILDRFLVKAPPAVPMKPAAPPERAAPPPAFETPRVETSEPPAAPSRQAAPRARGGLSGVDKVLEETLSGLKIDVKKPRAASVEATVPLGTVTPPPPIAPAPPSPPPVAAAPPPPPPSPAPEPPAPAEAPSREEVTSEDLFGDVIQDVLEVAPAAKEESALPAAPVEEKPAEAPPPPTAPKAEETPRPAAAVPPAAPEALPEPTVRMTVPPAAPKEAKKAPTIDLDRALGPALQGIAGLEDSTVRRLKAKSESELSKKLEETLSGVKLGAPRHVEAPAPEAPPPPPPPPAAAVPEEPEPAAAPAQAAPAAPPVPETPKAPPELEKSPTKEGVPFGNYLLIDKIAVGGMAELFKARQNGLEGFKRIVAIKRILPHLAANQEFVTMFTDEAKLAAQLNHPNIGHIYDLGKLEDSYFIAMEYVDGRDLRAILKELDSRQAKMSLRVAVYIAQKVCAALHYAHTAKDVDGKPMDLVHRDVSPQNIILSTTGEVKLVDFGIAKAASKASHTQSGALKGKLLYMSPEQAWGKTINHQADIFALGSVLWEMLTGRKLFYGDSEMSILEKVREAKVEPPRKYREEIPEELERIVLKALEKDLDARYATCQAMQAELERFAYEEWETLPSAYDAAAFLNGFFPDVYTREILGTLKKEPEGAAPEARPARAGRPPKSQRGKPAPPARKEKAPEAAAPPAPEPPKAAAPPPPPPKAEPKAAAPPKVAAPPPPPPKSVEETTGSRLFGDVVERPAASKKTLVLAGAVAAALVVVLILVFALRGKKPPAPPVEPAPAPASEQGKGPETAPAPAPPPVVQTPAPVPPAAGAPQATEAEIAAARRSATAAFTAFSKAVTDLEQAGAAQYVPDSLNSLKQSQANLQALLRRAKTPEEFKAAEDGSRQGETLSAQVKTQLSDAKAAAEREAAQKAAEAEAAKKAQEEAQRRAAEEEAQKQAQAGKTKPGDFVDLWAVDVKPRETQKVPVAYTPQARQNKVQGTVYVEVSISETGQVTSASVVRGLKPDYGLHDACVKAALQTRYSPAIKDGVPVKTKMTYPVVFKIQ